MNSMAGRDKRLQANVDGDFFVDSSCINCGTCRWMAPAVFDQEGDGSRVHRQPRNATDLLASLRALVTCPTASIGTIQKHNVAAVAAEFPTEVASNVYHCGYHHRSSYGAASYLIVRPQGNVLVDSPRFAAPLLQRIEALGGIKLMFLTHRDDVADHQKFAEHFGCERILHADDVTASTREVEIQPTGTAARPIDEDLLMIPVPGHTAGSSCLLVDKKFLFTGDHLAWSLGMGRLTASRDVCWFDWPTQIESMRRLAEVDFEHVLPGHGAPCHFSVPEMRAQMLVCLQWITAGPATTG